MLYGTELAAAIRAAMEKKGVRDVDVARAFGVKPPSVGEWKVFGRLHKKHIPKLLSYFGDVVDAEYWGLDQSHQSTELSTELPSLDLPEIRIEEYDVAFAMGGGQVATADTPEVIQVWHVTHEWLRVFLPEFRGDPKTLKIAKGVGDCLASRYESGDMLLIDISHKGQPLRADGTYAFRWEGLLYIKELRPIGLRRAAAHDKDGKAFDIDYEKDEFEVIAKVMRAWRIEK